MRIMHFLNHTRPNNGHVHVAVDLACVQSRMGHSVSVVSGGGAFDPLFADLRGQTYRHRSEAHDSRI